MVAPLRRIALLTILSVVIIGIAVLYIYRFSKPSIVVEIYPTPPIMVVVGGEFTLGISIRNNPGLHAEAKSVFGVIKLPEGFLDEYFHSRERRLIFGDISPGDASHYGLNIVVQESVSPGEHHISLVIWGDNVPRESIDIEVMVSQ
jgi:predicted transcriptional regulator